MRLAVFSTGHIKFGKLKQDIGELMFGVCSQMLSKANADIDAIDAINIHFKFLQQFYGGSASDIRVVSLKDNKYNYR